MTPRRLRQWVTIFLLATTSAASNIRRDFTCARVLPDGELERRVRKGHVSAIETTVEIPLAATPDPQTQVTGSQQALTLLQATDSRHFIQLIYDSSKELRDCEYIKSQEAVDSFYRVFDGEDQCPSGASSNVTFSVDYKILKRQCKVLHRKVRQMTMRNQQEGLRRLKRDLFLYPGTNWCGSGSNARGFTELGYNAAADRCCRDHDHCPYTIEGFTRMFNFFNFRFHTISHCDCDERFRACLKLSGTAAGNMVGKLFFNVVQTKCFLFKNVKKCAKRSWWGKCLKFEKEKTAFLRDALKY